MLVGQVSEANSAAVALDVRHGPTGNRAAKPMLVTPPGRAVDLSAMVDQRLSDVLAGSVRGGPYAVWTFILFTQAAPHHVVCVASHAGRVMAGYALRAARPSGVIANDVGGALDASGTSGLRLLDQEGIAAATVSA